MIITIGHMLTKPPRWRLYLGAAGIGWVSLGATTLAGLVDLIPQLPAQVTVYLAAAFATLTVVGTQGCHYAEFREVAALAPAEAAFFHGAWAAAQQCNPELALPLAAGMDTADAQVLPFPPSTPPARLSVVSDLRPPVPPQHGR